MTTLAFIFGISIGWYLRGTKLSKLISNINYNIKKYSSESEE